MTPRAPYRAGASGAVTIVFAENGQRRNRQAVTEAELAVRLEKVRERFAAPVIAKVTCQDIKVTHMRRIVSAAPTADEGARLHRCLSALAVVADNCDSAAR